MNKVAHYLQEHLVGEVMTSNDARRYFATDTSILTLTPSIIVYPRNENDVRKAARFTWQLAERGRVIPLTARGAGTDQAGAALSQGILLVFPAHMNRVLELDAKSGQVSVEPGLNYGKLQQTLLTHGRFLPPFPASFEYSTIGGAVGNNASGQKSVKYGSTRDYVQSLRVVLANGEVIETSRINKRELNKKLGLATFEGEIYRSLDKLIEESQAVINSKRFATTKNATGYALSDVKHKDGSFDLTPLFVGSQGTLGIVTETTLDTEPHSPTSTLLLAQFDDLNVLEQVVTGLRAMGDMPSAIEMVDENLLNFVQRQNPNQLKGVLDPPFAKVVLLIEFDDPSDRTQKRLVKKAEKLLKKFEVPFRVETDPTKQDEMWKVRHSAATITAFSDGPERALPIIEDGVVPPEKFAEYLNGVYDLFKRHGLQVAIWGHAGDANVHMQPLLNLGQVGDRQKALKLMDEYYSLVISLGGSTSGEHNDGRVHALYLEKLYGPELYELFKKVKAIFDPYGTLNPGVKWDVTLETLKPMFRDEYSLDHFYEHLPRS